MLEPAGMGSGEVVPDGIGAVGVEGGARHGRDCTAAVPWSARSAVRRPVCNTARRAVDRTATDAAGGER